MGVVYTIKLEDLASGVMFKLADGAVKVNNNLAQTDGIIGKLNSKLQQLNLDKKAANSETEIAKLNTEIRETQKELNHLDQLPPKTFMQRISDMPGMLKGAAGALAGVFAVQQVGDFLADVRETTATFEGVNIAINTVSGSAEEGKKNIRFLSDTANDMGIDLEAARDGFLSLAGATKGTALQGEQTRQIFKGVSTAVATMHLSSDAAKGAMLAMGQMMSKGVVSSEELRGQLGERLPGAMQAAARAMGKSDAEFNKMLNSGQIMAKDFLPAFAAELQKTYGGGLTEASQSMRAEMNRQHTQFLNLKVTLGQALEPAFLGVIKVTNTLMAVGIGLASAIKSVTEWAGRNKDILIPLTSAVTAGAIAYGLYTAWIQRAVIWNSILGAIKVVQTGITVGLTAAQTALNTAFLASPLGWIVLGVGAVVGVTVWLWNTFEGFRGFLYGLWGSFKEVFMSIWDIATNILGGIGKMVIGFMTGDIKQMKEGLANFKDGIVASNPIGYYKEYGHKIVGAFYDGQAEGVADFKKDKQSDQAGSPGVPPAPGDPAAPGAIPGVPGAPAGANTNLGSGLSQVTGDANASKNITINIDSLVKNFSVSTTTMRESYSELKAKVYQALMDVLNDGQIALG